MQHTLGRIDKRWMKIVGHFCEATGGLLIASFIEEEDFDVPPFHRKSLHVGRLIAIENVRHIVSPLVKV